MASSDWELVQRARQGDREAFRELVERYQRKIAALALGKVGASVIALGLAPQKPISAPVETRTAALLASSVDLLKRLEVCDGLKSEAAPLFEQCYARGGNWRELTRRIAAMGLLKA